MRCYSAIEKAVKQVALLCADGKCGSCSYNDNDKCLLAETRTTPNEWLKLSARYRHILKEEK